MLSKNYLRTKVYGFAVLLIGMGLSTSACTSEPLVDVETGSEVVEAEGLVEGEDVVVEGGEIDDVPLSIGVLNAYDNTIRASKLLDYDFRNTNGDVTGEIENILIDISTGQILFVTIEYGGFLDLGDTHLAMPFSAFSWGAENELVLNIDEERLENFPSLGEDWPDLSNELWDEEVNQFWSTEGINPGVDITNDTSQVMYISELLDGEIGDIDFGEGEIHDVLINLSQSQGRYVVVDYGDELFSENLVAVPFSAFHGRMIDGQLHFNENINLEMLERAPTLDRSGFDESDLFERDFDREIIEYWGGEGYDIEYEAGS